MTVGQDILIRRIGPGDADAYLEIFGDPQICEYDDFSPVTPDQIQQEMARICAGYQSTRGEQEFAIEWVPTGTMVGVLAVIRKLKYTYLGYHIHRRYQRRGIASRAVQMYIASLHPGERMRLRARIDPDNLASAYVALKCGFERIGRAYHQGKAEHVYAYRPAQTFSAGQVEGAWLET